MSIARQAIIASLIFLVNALAACQAPLDPTKDKRVALGIYSVAVNPADGSIWGTSIGYPGYVVRVAPGADPTHTA